MKAYESLRNLVELLEDFEQYKRKSGKGRPENLQLLSVIRNIVLVYREHLAEPTTYKDGPFFIICSLVLEVACLPYKDPLSLIIYIGMGLLNQYKFIYFQFMINMS